MPLVSRRHALATVVGTFFAGCLDRPRENRGHEITLVNGTDHIYSYRLTVLTLDNDTLLDDAYRVPANQSKTIHVRETSDTPYSLVVTVDGESQTESYTWPQIRHQNQCTGQNTPSITISHEQPGEFLASFGCEYVAESELAT